METSRLDKGGFPIEGINLALCENPLPPLDEAIDAMDRQAPQSNRYTEPYSHALKESISAYVQVPVENIHINAGSELILRQLFVLYGQRTHLFSPTYYLFEEIAGEKTHTVLDEKDEFSFDMKDLAIPSGTTMAVIVNPNNPNGGLFDIKDNLGLLRQHRDTLFLIDEAFIEFGGADAADLVHDHPNVIITRTFSKAFSLAGCRVGYAVARKELIDRLNRSNDAYPLARTAEAAAMASLEHIAKIRERVTALRTLASGFARSLQGVGVRTYPTVTYFFLGEVPGMSAHRLAQALAERNIHLRPLYPGDRFLRFATSTAENNRRVIDAMTAVLGGAER
jgi:histidinol-phosphate aminotransferase